MVSPIFPVYRFCIQWSSRKKVFAISAADYGPGYVLFPSHLGMEEAVSIIKGLHQGAGVFPGCEHVDPCRLVEIPEGTEGRHVDTLQEVRRVTNRSIK